MVSGQTATKGIVMASAFEEVRESRQNLVRQLSEGQPFMDFQASYTEVMDQYFRRSLEESETGKSLYKKKDTFAFVAVGGYGRKELCVHSDIDIMILFKSKLPDLAKELANDVFFPLWDLGLDLGYGIRSIKDCVSLSANDHEVLTSLMDARFICGDSPLYLSLMDTLQKKVIRKKFTAFCRWLDDCDKIRMNEYGDASYLLEPHLKEGIGGLRDYHHILWMAKAHFGLLDPRDLEYEGKLSYNEYHELMDHLAFIWLVRNQLHLLSGRRNDQLHFEYQEEIAKQIGFKDAGETLAVEQFLGKLHSCMTGIKSLHGSFINTHLPKKGPRQKGDKPKAVADGLHLYQGEIYFDSSKTILQKPLLLIDIFEKSSELGCRLALESRRLVREFLYLIDDTFNSSENATRAFLNIISNKYTYDALDQMFELGFLEIFIPEFSAIKNRVQYDAYHMFPVGRHSLEAVKELKAVANQKELFLLDIFSELEDPRSLFLAALLHDIGKGSKNHAKKGVSIAQTILKRMGYDSRKTENILFLIKHHLLLAETATRRDLNDEKAVVLCASIIGDKERLKMLFLLTWADSRATGPKVWNAWTSNLVQELFFKILHILEGNELATEQASNHIRKTLSEVSNLLYGRIEQKYLQEFFDVMTPRYLLNTGPKDIKRHVLMVKKLRDKSGNSTRTAFVFNTKEDAFDGHWELVFSSTDRPGLFSDLTGVLALNNINILSAEVYTWQDGTVLDIFRVDRPPDHMHADETWDRIKKDLEYVFRGKLSLAYRLGQKAKPSILSKPKKESNPPTVVIDNKSSDFFTLIEVFSDDRVGLLYDITRTLFELRLDIRIAKIATKVDQVADVFYVLDLEGQKIEDADHIMEITHSLKYQLA